MIRLELRFMKMDCFRTSPRGNPGSPLPPPGGVRLVVGCWWLDVCVCGVVWASEASPLWLDACGCGVERANVVSPIMFIFFV